MCIFAQPVLSVNNTLIFARLSGTGTQFLAYQMNYESAGENAMILPVPVKQPAGDTSLNFIDLKGYETFFNDLAKGFPVRPTAGIGCSAPANFKSADAMLRVFEVGNYIASFVPTMSDFDRLDPKFKLPNEIWGNIPGYENYGFAVFQLAAGSLKPHPMAFEFETDNDDLFFPTIHIHDGEVHPSEHFDHMLYLQHAGLDSKVQGYQNADVEDRATGLVRSKEQAAHFCKVDKSAGLIHGDLLLHRKRFQGMLPNQDTVFALSGDPIQRSLNLRSWLPYAPWLIALAAVGWFFQRRSKLKSIRKSKRIRPDDETATQHD